MNDQTPAIILLMVACMMFGAFKEYNIPWNYRLFGVFLIAGVPLIILISLAWWERRKQRLEAKET